MRFIKEVKNQLGQNVKLFESGIDSEIIARISGKLIRTGSSDETDFFEGSEFNTVLAFGEMIPFYKFETKDPNYIREFH